MSNKQKQKEMSLKEKIMLVDVGVSKWGARKFDAAASKRITSENGAKQKAARVNKLLIESPALDKISNIEGQVRTYLYSCTLPWNDKGLRILPVTKYFEFLSKINEFKNDFEEAVNNFMPEYERLRTEVWELTNMLGTLYNERDYPNEHTIRGKFELRIHFMPLYDGSDFRVKLADDEVELIRASIEEDVNNKIAHATEELFDKARELVLKMAEKLADPNAIYRDSLIENIRAFNDTLPVLNFNNDPKIDYIHGLLKDVSSYDPEVLRWKLSLRKDVAEKAKKIYDLI